MLPRLLICAALSFSFIGGAKAATCEPIDWPLWDSFKQHFLQDSGRVLDASVETQYTTSEGQSYGMFFALLANDRKAFEQMWTWSVDNLASGDMSKNLPAWSWGKTKDNEWKVLDANTASDANVWFAYALLEAGRLWGQSEYEQSAQQLLALIQEQEFADLPEFGPMLLPGKNGFVRTDEKNWLLNLSYLPIPVLRYLSGASVNSEWQALVDNTLRFMQQATPKGLAADWNVYQQQNDKYVFTVDEQKGAEGSYDAIRTYLWAGMTDPADPLAKPVLQALSGMAELMQAEQRVVPPEKVDTLTGQSIGEGPFGFSAALLPYFISLNDMDQAQWQRERVQVELRAAFQPVRTKVQQPPYYDVVLSLFGQGWADGYYRFEKTGSLRPKWEKTC